MTHQGSRKRWFGAVASLAAAYALVLNVVLSSLLLAGISPADAAAGYQICHTDNGLAAVQTEDGKATGKPAAHCPLCTASHAPGAPPAHADFTVTRIALAIASPAVPDDIVVAQASATDHRARAPPPLN